MKRKLHFIAATLVLIFTAQWVSAQSANGYFTHTVTKGQGLYSISRMYGVTENEIIALNPGSEVVIKVGQQLRIPQKEQINAQNNAEGQRFHTIKTGETLYRLTVIYGLKARDICDANPGLSAENFKVGQVIVIPQKENDEQENVPVTETSTIETPQSEQVVQQVSTADSDCRLEHLVKRKETIYRISRMYGITELELLNANPELKTRNLAKGEIICIPYSSKEKVAVTITDKESSPKTEPQDIQIPSNESLFAEVRTEIQDIDQIKAAILLPFILKEDSISSETQKMVEFYEGFLLALDSLKKEGVSVDVHVYDTGNEWQSINPILERPEMHDMNIIIGPVYKKHIEEAANFANTTGIRLVLPFERKVDQVFTNPYIYQINTPQSYFYSEVYEHFFTQFQHPNVILFQSEGEKEDGMIAGFKQELESRQVPYTVLVADTATNKDTIRAYLDVQRENILMMISEKVGGLNNMMPVFQLLVRDTASTKYDIHLFGYPQYQVYTSNHLASFYEIDTYFYSSFYTNNLLPQAVNFHKKYRRNYSKEIVNRFPKYAILGFDIGYYFLKALHLYGTDIDNRINEMQYVPIQTGFKFERVTTWGGFINRKVFFVHMSKEFELQTIDFD